MEQCRKRDDGKALSNHRTIAQLMPFHGFTFSESLLQHLSRTRWRSAFKRITRTLIKDEIDRSLSSLVREGINRIGFMGEMPHRVFWHGISDAARWSHSLTGQEVFKLVVVLIQAHEAFERNPPPHSDPKRYGPTARAVHEFAKLLKEKYADNAGIMDLYFSPLPAHTAGRNILTLMSGVLDLDEEKDKKELEKLMEQQQAMFAEARARHATGGTSTSGHEMEVDSLQCVSKGLEDGGSHVAGQAGQPCSSKQSRDDDGDEVMEEIPEVASKRPRVSEDADKVEEVTENVTNLVRKMDIH